MTNKFPMVYLEWDDSRSSRDYWKRVGDMSPLSACKCVSVGFIVEEDKKTLRLALHVADLDGDRNNVQTHGACEIPKCAITKRRRLK